MYKFEKLEVYKIALDYVDLVYVLAGKLPRIEEFNLKPQMLRAATSVVLNIAEGSTGQSDAEQARFLGMAIRSVFETVACRQLICRRGYVLESDELVQQLEEAAEKLSRKLQAMRKGLARSGN
jgi:four helix bundle protein